MHFLTFNSHFDKGKGYEWGRLCLNHLTKGTLEVWIAGTSTTNKQYAESFHERGGMLPPQYRCNIPNWQVLTKPIYMPHKQGIHGNFYKINPHEVTTDKGGKRGDFGIHWDGYSVGSLGCIIMSRDRFQVFEQHMGQLYKEGINKIPLFVSYS